MITPHRLDEIANVPECANSDEVREMAYDLGTTRKLLELRQVEARNFKASLEVARHDLRWAHRRARTIRRAWILAWAITVGVFTLLLTRPGIV